MKKIISTILATALLCSSATIIPASAAWDNNGKYHNYNNWKYYHTDDPAAKTDGWSDEIIAKRTITVDGVTVGTLKCHYNKDFLGSDEAKAEIAGQSAGIYYDCYVVEVGKKTARSSTTRGKGNSTKWMNDSNGSTNWYGNVYWE